MKILAIEQSTGIGSIALLEDAEVLAEESWTESRGRSGNLFDMLPGALRTASWTVADVDLFAIGLGPGSFSGLRTSLSAANHLALPGRKPVIGVPSARAIAWRTAAEREANYVTVVGDARRKRFWHARFKGPSAEQAIPFSLLSMDELTDNMSGAGLLVSPDWDRIGDTLQNAAGSLEPIPEAMTPRARSIGKLAFHDFDPANLPPPPEPIYMHPPVFVEPKFPK